MSLVHIMKNPRVLLHLNRFKRQRVSSLAFVNSLLAEYSKISYLKKIGLLRLCCPPSRKFHATAPRNKTERSNTERSNTERILPVEDLSKPMVKLTFIKHSGEKVEIEGRVGLTVMQEAVRNKLPMEAACAGQCNCTTCHVYVEEVVMKDPDLENPYEGNTLDTEEDVLDRSPFCKPNSRLTCQLIISADCENVRFKLPKYTTHMNVDQKKEDES